jgi:hypothetical protein
MNPKIPVKNSGKKFFEKGLAHILNPKFLEKNFLKKGHPYMTL